MDIGQLSSSEATIKEQQKSGHEIKEEHNHTEEESGEKDKKEHDEIYHTDLYQRDEQKNYGGGFKSENKNQKQRVEKGKNILNIKMLYRLYTP